MVRLWEHYWGCRFKCKDTDIINDETRFNQKLIGQTNAVINLKIFNLVVPTWPEPGKPIKIKRPARDT